MTKLTRAAATICMGLFATSIAAQDYKAPNGMRVTATGPHSFEVSGMAELWARDYWCAAASYASRVLGLPGNAPIYVSDPYERGDRSIGFSTVPGDVAPSSAWILGESVRREGATHRVGHAISFCADRNLRRG
ncbi:hypothetical protein E4Z66_11380 [Aliishimia ponticola]|uniref:Uncharacterized protein n=1 Tax=Aliishimia ponticola TaxID=2499833 RepID=A0A4S4NAI2_9RHOB|nr:hypothetical protein [Aliishimia ponticola]THH35685.1 hypothetical protein E4Z66_11380 [Aliishimia ponticola]